MMADVVKCPRCEITPLLDPTGPGLGKSCSRVTRDGGADVWVCDPCGMREALRPTAGLPDVPITAWPLSLDELQREDRIVYEFTRNSDLSIAGVDPDVARDSLEGGES